MYYGIVYDRHEHRIERFGGFMTSSEGLGFRITQERRYDCPDYLVMSVGAADLWTLESSYQAYFPAASDKRDIRGCYFCRTILGDRQGSFSPSITCALSELAWTHGHCLLCHHPYPVWDGTQYSCETGLIMHYSYRCPVFSCGEIMT